MLKMGARIEEIPGEPFVQDLDITRLHDLLPALVGVGMDINARDEFGHTALMVLAEVGSVLPIRETIWALVEHGADPTITNGEGWTAVDFCRHRNSSGDVRDFEGAVLEGLARRDAKILSTLPGGDLGLAPKTPRI
jgi:hypothetical protein